MKNVLTKEFDKFNGRDEVLDENLEFIARTMFHMQDKEDWKKLRSGLARGMTGAKLRTMTEEKITRADLLLSKIPSGGGVLEIKDISSDYTTEVSFSCFFGLDVKTGR